MRTIIPALSLLLSAQLLEGATSGKTPLALDPARISEIAAMLPAKPRGLGDPISERARWDELRAHPAFSKVIPEAEELLKTGIPEKPESLVLDYKNTGNRNNWQRVDSQWRRRLTTLFLAECLEDKGRFLPALEEIIAAFCDEPTWVMPAHDGNQGSYYGRVNYADLKAADVGMSLGTIDWVIGEKLKPALRERLKGEVMRRNLTPYLAMVTGTGPLEWWWITGTNNWNAVCQAGITGAALALVEDPRERAVFVAAAEAYSRYFLSGFTADGYCSEGMGYWGYGYGHFILLTEFIHQATGGKVDLLQCEGARAAGRFGGVLEITHGIHPAFADCSIGSRPPAVFMHYLSRRYGFGFEEWDKLDPAGPSSTLASAVMFSFPNSASGCRPGKPEGPRLERRTWFNDAGVLICRPGDSPSTRLAVAMKGGHNGEHHNHNDVGSYLVVSGREALLVDPGAEVYTRRTFSSKRYDSKVLNSFGHPLPVVAGKLQSPGGKARGVVVSTSFTEPEDRLVIDLKSAYAVPELRKLERSFCYSREGRGSFRVSDTVVFDSPQNFETALVTLVGWARIDADTLSIRDLDEGIRVAIDVTGGEFEIVPVEINEDVRTRNKPTRIGIRMKQPAREATITLTITPDGLRGDKASSGLFNGGFEMGSLGWRISDDGIGSLESGIVSAGKSALRIRDGSKTNGSNISSSRVDVDAGAGMVISGRQYPVSGKGIGLYVNFYDQDDKLLNKKSSNGNTSPVMVLGADPVNSWSGFSSQFTTPPGTDYLRLWIHSMNGAVVDAVLDEIEIRPDR